VLKPMFDCILVKKMDETDKSTGGIALVGNEAKDRFERGIVKAVGPGRRSNQDVLISLTVKAGDKVMFDRGIGVPITVDLEDLHAMFEGDVRFIIT